MTEALKERYRSFGIGEEILQKGEESIARLSKDFAAADAMAEANQMKVIAAMQEAKVSGECFAGSTGYGYGDYGRETLEKVYANCFKGKAALVRPQITCGTHALALALMSNLRPGDELLSPAGRPYDTLEGVIGIRPQTGSLAEYGVTYREVELTEDGGFDLDGIKNAISEKTKLVTIQRSRGYATRPSFTVERIRKLIAFIKGIKPELNVMVDNCYGEFVEAEEPLEAGADLVVGSLIKNPGGGLAPTGGYLVGSEECIEQAAYRLTAPGLGREVGATTDSLRLLYQGLFLAPVVASNALKGAMFAADLFGSMGYEVSPRPGEDRTDIIQSVSFGTKEGLCAFCEGIQAAAPVEGYVRPEPWDMPGYADPVIMAAGTFISGSSIELSADGPLRDPYAAYFQGGLTFAHAKAGILLAAQRVCDVQTK